jgi:CDP-2,3-bis-(O-geranylgeranyl)-sn-glycerol synthase
MLVTGVALSVGAILGDIIGSFIKRRLDLKESHGFPLMDQYLFFVVALLFALPFGHFPDIVGILVLVVLTGVLHRLTNILAYMAKLKKVPW